VFTKDYLVIRHVFDYMVKILKKPIKIFLGDLIHNSVGTYTGVFPLNIGYIASSCISKFGQDVDITLFKYVEDLDKAINESPPTILGLSNYAWCHNIGLEFFQMLKLKNPNALTVWGGPNFPIDMEDQKKFMKKNSQVDVYVPIEGETGFSNIVQLALSTKYEYELPKKISEKPIDGCITRNSNGDLQYNNPVIRTSKLDSIPSPYTSGILDKFFDGKLTPMMQTNRGCPFTCTFCVDGLDNVQKVNQFSLERVKEELNYISQHVSQKIHSLHFSDLNFGMFPRDLEICDIINETKKEYNYPTRVLTTTGKNKKERIIQAIKRLDGTMSLTMSVQSMDEQVLQNVRRENISVDAMLALMPSIKEAGLLTESEVILCLPGDTYETHLNTIKKLIHAKLDSIQVYTCMLLDGSEMATPQQRKKWNFKTKFRVLPGNFSKISNGNKIIEIEEVIVGSDALTFDEYLELRMFAFVLWTSTVGIIYDPILKFLRQNNIDVFDLFFRMMKQVDTLPLEIRNIFDGFKNKTISELWDSKEKIISNYKKESEFQKLLNGEDAMNVIQYHNFLLRKSHMDKLTEYLFKITYSLLEENKIDEELKKQFYEIKNYCFGLGHNLISKNRDLTNPQFVFNYDIKNWVVDSSDKLLENFKMTNPIKLEFKFEYDQSKIFQDELDRADSLITQSQALKRIPVQMQWRHPVLIEAN
jgi:radical SAM superfamily enzyme YgiQ (UPF0313 family)